MMDIITNVGVVILNEKNQIFLGKRVGIGWSMPQGDIHQNEELEDALIREIYEELGISITRLQLNKLPDCFYYMVPISPSPLIKKQFWYVIRLNSQTQFNFYTTKYPEFKDFIWTDINTVINKCIWFKRSVYRGLFQYIQQYLDLFF